MKAIIVEDNEANYILVKEILQPLGWESRQVVRAREVMSAIESDNPDMIIMDISLPDGDGLELTRELREKGVSTPIVVMSAHAFAEVGEKARRMGANFFFPKPFDLSELESIVTNVATGISTGQSISTSTLELR